jgi:hypothetical protein
VRQLKQKIIHQKKKLKILLREKGASSLALTNQKQRSSSLCTGTAAGCLLHFNWLNKHQLGAVALRTSDSRRQSV